MIFRLNANNIDNIELHDLLSSINEIWNMDYDDYSDDFHIEFTEDGGYIYGEIVLNDEDTYYLDKDGIVIENEDFVQSEEMTKKYTDAERSARTLLNSFGFRKPR